MINEAKNKAVDNKPAAPVLTEYFYPEMQVTIKAATQEEADEKYQALKK